MICSWVNSARPSSANSVPMPDCLAPPKGMCGAMSRCLLIHTVPASIWLATLWARAVFDDRQHRAELLLIDQFRAFLDVAHDGRFDEVAGTVHRRAAGNDIAVLAGVFEEAL